MPAVSVVFADPSVLVVAPPPQEDFFPQVAELPQLLVVGAGSVPVVEPSDGASDSAVMESLLEVLLVEVSVVDVEPHELPEVVEEVLLELESVVEPQVVPVEVEVPEEEVESAGHGLPWYVTLPSASTHLYIV